jgi:2-keto-4-pentenoate hydratase/2-oxohepta-3-ene-1,7-dioic acid hydratase in catechol pathway
MVTHLSIEEAENLMITTTVDDERRQHDSTRLMLHKIVDLVVYISSFTTLLPGDVILTGTPAGVGPMEVGQRVSVEIDGIGTLSNPVVAAG